MIHACGEKWVLRSLGKKWKEYKCDLKSDYFELCKSLHELLSNRPEHIPRDQWTTLALCWHSDKVKV